MRMLKTMKDWVAKSQKGAAYFIKSEISENLQQILVMTMTTMIRTLPQVVVAARGCLERAQGRNLDEERTRDDQLRGQSNPKYQIIRGIMRED